MNRSWSTQSEGAMTDAQEKAVLAVIVLVAAGVAFLIGGWGVRMAADSSVGWSALALPLFALTIAASTVISAITSAELSVRSKRCASSIV